MTSHSSLGTMQRNALSQYFGRKEFTPEEVAELDYCVVLHLPKIGDKGIALIRSWLRQYGLDLGNLPLQGNEYPHHRLRTRLQQAEVLLRKHGYRIEPP